VRDTGDDNSENQDLRSVIDDLTIENKRLRQYLRDQRQRHGPLLDRDQIFEIRTRGLPSSKKHELEAMLQKFATTLVKDQSETSQTPDGQSPPGSSSRAALGHANANTTCYHQSDSAYASMSNSGLTSVAKSNHGRSGKQQMCGSRSNKIRSFLHNIPDTLLSKDPSSMSEKSRMNLVVKKLEQLFTGTLAVPGEHSQPMQQQKVSESAAETDLHDARRSTRLAGLEGSREAPMLPQGIRLEVDPPVIQDANRTTDHSNSMSERSSSGRSTSGACSPVQRPTRPLDLDVHRAQVPEENIDYIRHLGPPTPLNECDQERSEDGWVYLNLLTGMAQLHTINVTPAFVRKSITELSTKFELSKDARKIRWKGGSRRTGSSGYSNDSGEASAPIGSELNGTSSSQLRAISDTLSEYLRTDEALPTFHQPSESISPEKHHDFEPSGKRTLLTSQRKEGKSNFDYKPIFDKGFTLFPRLSHTHAVLHQMRLAQGSETSISQEITFSSSGFSQPRAVQEEDVGRTIYYNNPYFCRDLSRDSVTERVDSEVPLPLSNTILGLATSEVGQDLEVSTHAWTEDQCMNGRLFPEENLPCLELVPLSAIVNPVCNPTELAASGVGGVLPDDHFTLQVRRKLPHPPARQTGAVRLPQSSSTSTDHMKEKICSVKRVDLPSSTLPPPSYGFFSSPSETSNSVESDDYLTHDMDDEVAQYTQDPSSPFPANGARELHAASEQPTGREREHAGSHYGTRVQRSMRTVETSSDARSCCSEDEQASTLDGAPGIEAGSLVATVGTGSEVGVAGGASVALTDFSTLKAREAVY
jgi:hypothetical protein